jgi:hypothetical protein
LINLCHPPTTKTTTTKRANQSVHPAETKIVKAVGKQDSLVGRTYRTVRYGTGPHPPDTYDIIPSQQMIVSMTLRSPPSFLSREPLSSDETETPRLRLLL